MSDGSSSPLARAGPCVGPALSLLFDRAVRSTGRIRCRPRTWNNSAVLVKHRCFVTLLCKLRLQFLNMPFSPPLFSFVAPSEEYINSRTFEGLGALHLSARRGSLESVRVLLEAGADPNEVTIEATTPLFLGDTSFLDIPEQLRSREKLLG